MKYFDNTETNLNENKTKQKQPLEKLCYWPLAIIFILAMLPNSVGESAHKKPSST